MCGAARMESVAGGLCVGCLARRALGANGEGWEGTGMRGRRPRLLGDEEDGGDLPEGFEFVEALGRGGMGVVHLVFQRSLERYVAFKQMAGGWQDVPRARERFLREARAAARLSHPGMVAILEVGTHRDSVWYTMEFMEGGDVAALLERRGGRLPWREAVELVLVVGRAIHAAHLAGVAHRDLKPSNLLLDGSGAVRVTDFGLAWIANEEGKDVTREGEVVGTPAFLAPEALSGGGRSVDSYLADQYSLGALLFHLVTGRPPFTGAHVLETLAAILERPAAPRMLEVAPEVQVPQSVEEVCARCLDRKPDRRFASVGALVTALEGCVARPGSWAVPPLLGPATRRWALVAVAVMLLGVVGVIAPWRRDGPAATVEVHANEPILAVAGLQVLDGDPTTAQVAAGLRDELISTLMRVSDLRVVAGVVEDGHYPGTRPTHVLRGTVQRWQDSIRFTANLIEMPGGSVRWSRSFRRGETDLFNLQTDIATEVAVHLRAELRGDRQLVLRGTGSRVPRAQARYLEALTLAREAKNPVQDLERARALLEEVVTLDPGFALAFASLSLLHSQTFHWSSAKDPVALARALDTAQEAHRLNPHLAEAKLALGQYYWRGFRDEVLARPHFEAVLERSPHHAGALTALAGMNRRRGAFDLAAKQFRDALSIDPLNANLAYNTIDTLVRMRAYPAAAELLDRYERLLPAQRTLGLLRGDLDLLWKGEVQRMREVLDGWIPAPRDEALHVFFDCQALLLEQKPEEALRRLQASTFSGLAGQTAYLTREGFEAQLRHLAGDAPGARRLAEGAWPAVRAEAEGKPNNSSVQLHAAQVQALLGEVEAAEARVRRLLAPGGAAAVDAFDRGYYLRSLAILLAMAGRDASVVRPLLEEALALPDQCSEASLRLHPALRRFF
jgi:TolB-like protein